MCQWKTGGHSSLHHGGNEESRSDIEQYGKEAIEHNEKENQQHQQPTTSQQTNQHPEKEMGT